MEKICTDSSTPSSSQGPQIIQPRLIELCDELWDSSTKDKILLKVICKGEVFCFTSKRGTDSRILKYIAIDKEGHRIQLVLFDDNIELFAEKLELDHCCYISDFTMVNNAKEYGVFDCFFDLVLNNKAIIEPASEEAIKFVASPYRFEKHSIIERFMNTGDIFNLLGRIINIEIYSERKKIILLDKENELASVTVWPDVPDQDFLDALLPRQDTCVLAITSLKAKIYNGKPSISTTHFTRLLHSMADPVISEFFAWAKEQQTLQISPYKSPTPSPSSKSLLKNDQPLPGVTIQYVVKHPAEVGDKFSLFGYVSRIEFKNALWYESCPYCNKKIKKDEDGSCCPSYSSSQPPSTLRYLLRAHLVDWTQEELSVTLFDEASQQILGQSAADMLASFDDQDKLQEAVMEKMKDPFIFNVTRQERKFPDGRIFPQYIVDFVQEGLIPVKRRKLGFQFTNA